MASIALFLSGRMLLAALAMAAAAMMAYQAVFLIPILFCGVRLGVCSRLRASRDRRSGRLYATLLTPLARTHRAGNFSPASPPGPCRRASSPSTSPPTASRRSQHKLQNALMLFIHSLVDRLPRPGARRRRRSRGAGAASPTRCFLLAWIGIFFAGALAIFFCRVRALPAADGRPGRHPRLAPSRANGWRPPSPLQLALGARARHRQLPALGRLPHVRRRAARAHPPDTACGWITIGACATTWKPTTRLPARKGQHVRPGDIVVSSELGHNVEFTAPLSRLADADIESTLPLRLIGLNSHSGYSTVDEGYLPFGFSTDPIDRVTRPHGDGAASHAGVRDHQCPRRRRADRQRHLSQRSLDVEGGDRASSRAPRSPKS